MPEFNEFYVNLIFICLYLNFTREFVDIIIYILRTHIQSILLAFLAYQRQSYLMINEKSKKRVTLDSAFASIINVKVTSSFDSIANEKIKKRATISISASIINAKASLFPETIAAIAFHPLKTYEHKLLERV